MMVDMGVCLMGSLLNLEGVEVLSCRICAIWQHCKVCYESMVLWRTRLFTQLKTVWKLNRKDQRDYMTACKQYYIHEFTCPFSPCYRLGE